MTEKHDAAVGLLEEPAEARSMEVEELRTLAAEGRERGYLTFEEIAACLEEVEVTKEQIADFRAHLVEAGVDIVSKDGRPHPGGVAESPPPSADGAPAPKKPEIDEALELRVEELLVPVRADADDLLHPGHADAREAQVCRGAARLDVASQQGCGVGHWTY